MSKYTLHYFPGNGRAVVARAILCYAKVDFTNDLIKKEDWPKIKKSGLCEFEQVPILEIDNKKYSQSFAINLYLAKKFNLLGKNDEEEYQVINVLNSTDDVKQPVMNLRRCTEENKKPELRTAALEKLKFILGKLNERYIANGKGKYFLGDHFSLADVVLCSTFMDFGDSLGECPCKIVSELGEVIKRVKENELKEFHEKYYIKPDPL